MPVDPNLFANFTPPNTQTEGGDLTPEQLLTLIDRQVNRHETRMARKEMFEQRELERLVNELYKHDEHAQNVETTRRAHEEAQRQWKVNKFTKQHQLDVQELYKIEKEMNPLLDTISHISDSNVREQLKQQFINPITTQFEKMVDNYQYGKGFNDSDKLELNRLLHNSDFKNFLDQYQKRMNNIITYNQTNKENPAYWHIMNPVPENYMKFNYLDSNEIDSDAVDNAIAKGDMETIVNPPHKKTNQINFSHPWVMDENAWTPYEHKEYQGDIFKDKYLNKMGGEQGTVTKKEADENFNAISHQIYGDLYDKLFGLTTGHTGKEHAIREWEVKALTDKELVEMKHLEGLRNDPKHKDTKAEKARLKALNQKVRDYKHKHPDAFGDSGDGVTEVGMTDQGRADFLATMWSALGEKGFRRWNELNDIIASGGTLTEAEGKELNALSNKGLEVFKDKLSSMRTEYEGLNVKSPKPAQTKVTVGGTRLTFVTENGTQMHDDFGLKDFKIAYRYKNGSKTWFANGTTNTDNITNNLVSSKNNYTVDTVTNGHGKRITFATSNGILRIHFPGYGKVNDDFQSAFNSGGRLISVGEYGRVFDEDKNGKVSGQGYTAKAYLPLNELLKHFTQKQLNDFEKDKIITRVVDADPKAKTKRKQGVNGYFVTAYLPWKPNVGVSTKQIKGIGQKNVEGADIASQVLR